MSRKLFIGIAVSLLIIGGFYVKKAAECFGSTGALNLPQITEVGKGQPITLPFKMLRIAAPGCFQGHSSVSYKDVSCGYRLDNSKNWILGNLIVMSDNETQYEVECQIPPLPFETLTSAKLEYYFEYSSWGNSPERKTGLLSIR